MNGPEQLSWNSAADRTQSRLESTIRRCGVDGRQRRCLLAAIALHNGAPPVVESAGFAPRVQTEADLEATRWGLVAWEDPRERSRFKPFWIDEKMLMAVVVEPGDPVGMMARETGMTVSGLRLLDGALVLKVKRGRRVEQIRVLEGDSFDMERTALQLQFSFDGFPPTATSRL